MLLQRVVWSSAAAFAVLAGFVLSEFVAELHPVAYLPRPLLAAAGISVIIGAAASPLGRGSVPVAVLAAIWVVRPEFFVWLGVAAAVLFVYRLKAGRVPNLDVPVLAGASVFLLASVVPVVPLVSWSTLADPATTERSGPAQYVVLLDAYPRADTLASHDIDISPFLDALVQRGFDLYPEATSRFRWTFQTLTEMTVGWGDDDHWETIDETLAERREIRDRWRLPDGFVAIAPSIGSVTMPNTPTLNSVGFNLFEERLLVRSVLAPMAGGWVMDGYRSQLEQALKLLASTHHRRVFAHLMAPHYPVLFDADGTPLPPLECWPADCYAVDGRPPSLTPDERAAAMGGYIHWLNGRLVEVIDQILAECPDAEIVLFSDHGGRFDDTDFHEWHRVFLASRTPSRPDLYDDSQHPGSVLTKLDG